MLSPIMDRLRQEAASSGLEPYQLSEIAQVDERSLRRFLCGEVGLSAEALDRLASALRLELTRRGAGTPIFVLPAPKRRRGRPRRGEVGNT